MKRRRLKRYANRRITVTGRFIRYSENTCKIGRAHV